MVREYDILFSDSDSKKIDEHMERCGYRSFTEYARSLIRKYRDGERKRENAIMILHSEGRKDVIIGSKDPEPDLDEESIQATRTCF